MNSECDGQDSKHAIQTRIQIAWGKRAMKKRDNRRSAYPLLVTDEFATSQLLQRGACAQHAWRRRAAHDGRDGR